MAKWLKTTDTLTFEVADRVARITLARPDKRNALTPASLAELADALLEADDARIGFPAARANGTPPQNMFVCHCGPQWAKRLLMTGDWISGRDAARIGLVMESVPSADLEQTVDALARRVALVDADLLAAHKRVVNLALELQGARTMQRIACELDS